jgi:hypothetical protein
MGNLLLTYNYHIQFHKFCYEPYFFEIHITDLNLNNIQVQLELLAGEKNILSASQIAKIINVLSHIFSTENEKILEQVDGYLFTKHNGMPFLAILNDTAKSKQRQYTQLQHTQYGYYYECDLIKTFGLRW